MEGAEVVAAVEHKAADNAHRVGYGDGSDLLMPAEQVVEQNGNRLTVVGGGNGDLRFVAVVLYSTIGAVVINHFKCKFLHSNVLDG